MYTILIVEDDMILQQAIKDLLLKQEKHYNILTSDKGREALKIAISSPIDLFIIDIKLPDWNGIKLSLELRKTYRHTPIIIQSSITDCRLQVKLYDEIENMTFLTKPFNPNKLIRKIDSAFSLINMMDTRRLLLKQRTTSCHIPLKHIIYIESINNRHNIRITMFDDDEHQLKDEEFYGVPLKELLVKLEKQKEFCRCHKSFIINLYKIEKLDFKNKHIHLYHTNQCIPIGDTYKNNLTEAYYGLDN